MNGWMTTITSSRLMFADHEPLWAPFLLSSHSLPFSPSGKLYLLAATLEGPNSLALPTSLTYHLQLPPRPHLGSYTGLLVSVKRPEEVPHSRPWHILCLEGSPSDVHRAHILAQTSRPWRGLPCSLHYVHPFISTAANVYSSAKWGL